MQKTADMLPFETVVEVFRDMMDRETGVKFRIDSARPGYAQLKYGPKENLLTVREEETRAEDMRLDIQLWGNEGMMSTPVEESGAIMEWASNRREARDALGGAVAILGRVLQQRYPDKASKVASSRYEKKLKRAIQNVERRGILGEDDVGSLEFILEEMKKERFNNAYQRARRLDTIVREKIPEEVWNFLKGAGDKKATRASNTGGDMNLKDELIRLGSERPDLRDNIRPVLDSMTKQAGSFNIRDEYLSKVDRHLSEVWEAKFDLMDKAENALSQVDIDLDEGRSRMDYYMHGSDGLLVGGKLHITDQAKLPRSVEDIDEAVQDAIGIHFYGGRNQPKDPREWIVKFGNWKRVKDFN